MSHTAPAPISPAENQWEEFVQSRTEAHLLQTGQWGSLKSQFGWNVDRVALVANDRIVAGAQMLTRPLPWGQSLAYLPKGEYKVGKTIGVVVRGKTAQAKIVKTPFYKRPK